MRRVRTKATSLGPAAVLLAVLSATAAGQERHELTGGIVAVYNLAGEVTVEPANGPAVSVVATRRGSDADRLDIAMGPIDGVETLRVIYPGDAIRYGRSQNTQLRVREDGTFGHGDGGRRVRISRDRDGLDASADLRIGVPRGQTLHVYQAVGTVTVSNVDGDLMLDTHSASVSTTATRGDLHIDVGSGEITVRGAEGSTLLDTGSGDVSAREVRGEELRIDTGSGDVTVGAVAVSELNIDTGSGDVDVAGSTAQTVLIDTGSGSVGLVMTGNPDDVAIDTGSGSVSVTVPGSFGAQVDIETSSGDIDLEFPVQVNGWERDHVRGTIGSGQGRLVVDTGSGSVSLLKGQ